MTEHEILTEIVKYFDLGGLKGYSSYFEALLDHAKAAIEETERQETLNLIGVKIDNISKLVEQELAAIPKIVDHYDGGYVLQGVDQNGAEVSIRLTPGEE